jgi:Spy/CpxP family protein refolding chaperone
MNGNKKGWIKPALLAVVLMSAGSIGVAAAHSLDWGHGGNGRCEQRHESRGFMSGEHRFEPGEHIDGMLAYLKAELKITADQEQAWQKFADVVRDNMKARAEEWQSRRETSQQSHDGKVPTVNERIDRQLQSMEQRTDSLKKMAEAAKTLYAQLTPEQQARADQMTAPHRDRPFRF